MGCSGDRATSVSSSSPIGPSRGSAGPGARGLVCGTQFQGSGGGGGQECIRMRGTSEAAPEAARQSVGGGCQSGWGQLLSVTNAIEARRTRTPRFAYHLLPTLTCPPALYLPP